jgi:hypothetical protein
MWVFNKLAQLLESPNSTILLYVQGGNINMDIKFPVQSASHNYAIMISFRQESIYCWEKTISFLTLHISYIVSVVVIFKICLRHPFFFVSWINKVFSPLQFVGDLVKPTQDKISRQISCVVLHSKKICSIL